MFDNFSEYINEVEFRINSDEKRLRELLSIIHGEGVRQPLIFYRLRSTRDCIAAALRESGVEFVEVSGASHPSREELSSAKAVVIQYAAGSEGIEFPCSNTSVFYENQYSYASLVQAQGRNVRRGYDHRVDHYYFVADVGFDKAVFDLLRQRKGNIEGILESISKQTLGTVN